MNLKGWSWPMYFFWIIAFSLGGFTHAFMFGHTEEKPEPTPYIIDVSHVGHNQPVKVITRMNTIYVWPCGQVGKENIEIINENEEGISAVDRAEVIFTYSIADHEWSSLEVSE